MAYGEDAFLTQLPERQRPAQPLRYDGRRRVLQEESLGSEAIFQGRPAWLERHVNWFPAQKVKRRKLPIPVPEATDARRGKCSYIFIQQHWSTGLWTRVSIKQTGEGPRSRSAVSAP